MDILSISFSVSKFRGGNTLLVMIGVHCFEKKPLKSFEFLTTIQQEHVVYKKRWYFRCSAFVHHSIYNLPIGLLRGARVIHFIT